MRRSGRMLARTALAALAALFVVGWIESSAPPAPLVAAKTEDLDKFAVTDMAEALARVANTSPTSDPAN